MLKLPSGRVVMTTYIHAQCTPTMIAKEMIAKTRHPQANPAHAQTRFMSEKAGELVCMCKVQCNSERYTYSGALFTALLFTLRAKL